MNEPDLKTITLAVLAGGSGSRMGGSKGLLKINGVSILQHLLNEARWPGPTLLVTAPGQEHPPGWEKLDREVSDPISGQGPLRGILTAIEHAPTSMLLIMPLDMPAFGHKFLAYLAAQLIEQPTTDAIMLSSIQHRVEPMPLAIRTSAMPMIQYQLASDDRSIHSLKTHPRVTIIPAPANWPSVIWSNLNRPDDLNDYLKINS